MYIVLTDFNPITTGFRGTHRESEMQNCVASLNHPLTKTSLFKLRIGAVPVLKMVIFLQYNLLTKLYEPSPTPCLYVAPAVNIMGRVPLIPLFLADNSNPIILHKYIKHQNSGFPMGSSDTAAQDGWRGNNGTVYEVNTWMWQFGRGKQRLGGQ
jgi:hypothetical protein